jgi:hypothetical protein
MVMWNLHNGLLDNRSWHLHKLGLVDIHRISSILACNVD